ncbi:MAG: hypothetical protein AABX82_09310, partial [Nanoarchaeota archaeon]
LLGGAVLATSVYAAEPTLQTTPDVGTTFVQENADKALKVAYIVAGKTCQVGSSENDPRSSRQRYMAMLTIDTGEQTYNVFVVDSLPAGIPDALTFIIYKEAMQVTDQGLDGHVNIGSVGKAASYKDTSVGSGVGKARVGSGVGKARVGSGVGKEHEPYFQELYMKALDAVITACEEKQ